MYDFFQVLGAAGGVVGILMIFGEYLLGPIAEHSFYMKAIHKLFLAKTVDDNLFVKKKHSHKHKQR